MRVRSSIGAALICLLAGALGLSACGGGGGGGEDFAEEANDACRQVTSESIAIAESPDGARENRAQAERDTRKSLASVEKEVAALEAIDPPSDSAAAYEKFVDLHRQGEALERKALKAAEEGDKKAFEGLGTEIEQAALSSHRVAAGIDGLDECAHRLPADEAKEVERVIEENETSADPAQCTDYDAPNVVKLQWKTKKACREFQSNESEAELPDSVDVEVEEGVTGVQAVAKVTFNGGAVDGGEIEYAMARQDGRWMLYGFRVIEEGGKS